MALKSKESSNSTKSSDARVRFCACDRERFKAGTYVFIKDNGVLTTVREEATHLLPDPVGLIDNQGQLVLNERGIKLVES